jgi:hypothetical protein
MTDNIEETNVQPPYSRREILLQEINTQLTGGTAGNIEELVPPPYTREEILLIEMLTAIENGGGGGGSDFIVTVTATSETTGTSDKTAAEIIEAVDAGKQIVVKTAQGDNDERWLYPSIVSRAHDTDEEVAVDCIMIDSGNDLLMQVLMPWSSGTENSWVLNTYPLTGPTVSQDSETGALTIS